MALISTSKFGFHNNKTAYYLFYYDLFQARY